VHKMYFDSTVKFGKLPFFAIGVPSTVYLGILDEVFHLWEEIKDGKSFML
jgi:hypothetical protein